MKRNDRPAAARQQARARELIAQHGPGGAARLTRLPRSLIIAAAAGAPLLEGSILRLAEGLGRVPPAGMALDYSPRSRA